MSYLERDVPKPPVDEIVGRGQLKRFLEPI